MRLSDLARMALHNLWSRKLRTTLNLLGVVIGCVMLIMTFAGTRGVSRGLHEIIRGSPDVRKFLVHRSYEPDVVVPEEALRVEGQMSDARKRRLQERLQTKWLNENAEPGKLGDEELKRLRALEHVTEVVPQDTIAFRVGRGEQAEEGAANGVSAQDARLADRIIVGRALRESERDGVLISEFLAYQLGFRSDEELRRLLGQPMELSFRVRGERMSWFMQALNNRGKSAAPLEQLELLAALQRLIAQAEDLPLSQREKELIRRAFLAPDSKARELEKDQGELFLTETFTIRGVFRGQDEDDPFSFLRTVYLSGGTDVCLHHETSTRLSFANQDFESFWSAIVVVDDVDHLRAAVDGAKELGFHANSALWIVENVDGEINKAMLAISALSLMILSVSAIGICNTMIVSVLERTAEFGIMKSLGARDRQVWTLMVLEGAITGVLGAAAAGTISLVLSRGVTILVRQYVSGRLGQSYAANVFSFSLIDALIVVLVSSAICILASLLPAYRAARLDPIVAMRRM